MENPIKVDDLGVPLFLETSIQWVFVCVFFGLHGRLGLDGIHGFSIWCCFFFMFLCRLTHLNKPVRFFLNRSRVSVGWGWIGNCRSSTEPFCKSLIRKKNYYHHVKFFKKAIEIYTSTLQSEHTQPKGLALWVFFVQPKSGPVHTLQLQWHPWEEPGKTISLDASITPKRHRVPTATGKVQGMVGKQLCYSPANNKQK